MSDDLAGLDTGDVHIQAHIATLIERTKALNTAVARHDDALDGIYSRLRTIERLAYIGVGGIVIISGMIGLFGSQIVKMDVSDRYRRADAAYDKQEQEQRESAMRQRIERLEGRK